MKVISDFSKNLKVNTVFKILIQKEQSRFAPNRSFTMTNKCYLHSQSCFFNYLLVSFAKNCVAATAVFQPLYNFWRSSSGIVGQNISPTAFNVFSSSTSFQ